MRGVKGGALLVVAVTIVLLVPSWAVAGAERGGPEKHHFLLRIESSGGFTADYGRERFNADTRGFGVDGFENVTWNWRVRATAKSVGRKLRDTRANFTGYAAHIADLVSYDKTGGELEESPICAGASSFNYTAPEPREGADRQWVAAPDETVVFEGRGFTIAYGFNYVLADACFHSIPTGDDGIKFFHPVPEDEARVPRDEFDPRSDRSFTWVLEDLLDRGPDHDLAGDHTEEGLAELSIEVKRVAKDTWREYNRRYDRPPVGDVFEHRPG